MLVWYTDINECLDPATTATCTDKEFCENSDGTYACLCADGYKRQGTTCVGQSSRLTLFLPHQSN